jgi:cytochrome c6
MGRLRTLGLLGGLLCLGSAHASDAELDLGKRLFTKTAVPACALCHTLKDAGSEGAVGPVLDEIKPDAARVAKALRDGLGNMPAFKTLTEAEIKALARYVAMASGGAASN